MIDILEKQNLKFDYIYDWTTNNNIKERKRNSSLEIKRMVKRKDKKNLSVNHGKYSDYEEKIKVKDIRRISMLYNVSFILYNILFCSF